MSPHSKSLGTNLDTLQSRLRLFPRSENIYFHAYAELLSREKFHMTSTASSSGACAFTPGQQLQKKLKQKATLLPDKKSNYLRFLLR